MLASGARSAHGLALPLRSWLDGLTLLWRVRILHAMSTLVQIESAVAGLPPKDQWSLLTWLQGRLKDVPQAQTPMPEALKVFRQLQQEVKLTEAGAKAWKSISF